MPIAASLGARNSCIWKGYDWLFGPFHLGRTSSRVRFSFSFSGKKRARTDFSLAFLLGGESRPVSVSIENRNWLFFIRPSSKDFRRDVAYSGGRSTVFPLILRQRKERSGSDSRGPKPDNESLVWGVICLFFRTPSQPSVTVRAKKYRNFRGQTQVSHIFFHYLVIVLDWHSFSLRSWVVKTGASHFHRDLAREMNLFL